MSKSAAYFAKCKGLANEVVRVMDNEGSSTASFEEASKRLREAIEKRPEYKKDFESSWSWETLIEIALHSPDRGYWTYAGLRQVAYFLKMPEMSLHAVSDFLGPPICALPEHFRAQIGHERFRNTSIHWIVDLWEAGIAMGVESGRWQKCREHESERVYPATALSPARFKRTAPIGSKPALRRERDPYADDLNIIRRQMELPFDEALPAVIPVLMEDAVRA